MIDIDLKQIKKKKKDLDGCKRYLKREFIGIDKIIDDLLDYIQIWYLMPELLTRPVIVNLWGMTGVGKTDLVRKMVKYLSYQDRFVEIELSSSDKTTWMNSVSQVMQENGLDDEKPGIILFDEIQRFNTISEDGGSLPQEKFKDFWELLSDGRLSKRSKHNFDSFFFNFLTKQKNNERKRRRGEEIEDEEEYLSAWQAKNLKRNLGLDLDMNDMLDLKEEEILALITQTKKQKKIYEPVNYSKTLVIVSGNLDEAFRMANQTSEADIDADIFHAFTRKITLVDVKNALSRKFRPEQVARFGNIHLIYTSLKKSHFEKLIQKEVNRVISDTKEKFGVDVTVDKSINRLIYRNGVFPVQGVRPVYSSIIDILETNLSKYLFEAILTKKKKIDIHYDFEKKQIIAKVGTETIITPYVGRIDEIRQSNELNNVANISVHEAGHAVAYMLLIGLAPLQVKSKISSSYAGGFTFPHQIHETKENILNKIKIYLAGGMAEEVIFGEENASIGRSDDREKATKLAVDYVRKYGFDDEFQSVYTMEEYAYTLNKNQTDLDIEKMISRLLSQTKELLIQNKDMLRDLSILLSDKGSLEATDMIAIAKKHGVTVKKKEEGYLHIANYDSLMNKKK